jgi:hypothetical protein
MSDYRAAPEDWTDCEHWAINGGAWDACILELRARVEAHRLVLEFLKQNARAAELKLGDVAGVIQ